MHKILKLAAILFIGLLSSEIHAESPIKSQKAAEKVADIDATKAMNIYEAILSIIKSNYVSEVSNKQLLESSLNGMLTSLDPHSDYLNNSESEALDTILTGNFGGLGILLTKDENNLVKVISCFDETPAQRADIRTGDLIINVNDEPVMDMTLTGLTDKMKGTPGTKVKLTIIREGEKTPLDFDLKRELIKLHSVKSEMFDKTAYIRISVFNTPTSDDFRRAVEKLHKENPQIDGYIIDMRNNGGGLLTAAIEIADYFLDKGIIVATKGKNLVSKVVYNAKPGTLFPDKKPIIVLINEGTASAPEIVAGALQDHKRAVILGTKSYGKGSVQEVMHIKDLNGVIKLTTGRYYTPSGRSIQAEGIVPDIVVEQAKIELLRPKHVMNEAKLKKHLVNDTKNKEVIKGKEDLSKELVELGKKSPFSDMYNKDFQLARAIDLVKTYGILERK